MDIKVDHISKAYGEQQVLQDLSCVFPEGKTTCIRGRSGCGKTTLIRLLLRLDVPDKGKIEGVSDRKLSAVFQCGTGQNESVSAYDTFWGLTQTITPMKR